MLVVLIVDMCECSLIMEVNGFKWERKLGDNIMITLAGQLQSQDSSITVAISEKDGTVSIYTTVGNGSIFITSDSTSCIEDCPTSEWIISVITSCIEAKLRI